MLESIKHWICILVSSLTNHIIWEPFLNFCNFSFLIVNWEMTIVLAIVTLMLQNKQFLGLVALNHRPLFFMLCWAGLQDVALFLVFPPTIQDMSFYVAEATCIRVASRNM
jgi:hypothetical protein